MKQIFLLFIIIIFISCNNPSKNYEDEWKNKMESRDFKGALTIVNSQINKDSLNVELYRMRGSSYFFMDDYDSAYLNYSLALNLDSKDAKTLSAMARLFLGKGSVKQAKSYIEQALIIEQNNAQIHLICGNIYAKEENYLDAEAEFRKTISIDNSSFEAYNNLANILVINREFEKAILIYTKALEINPNNSNILLHRGVAKFQINEKDEGLIDLSQSIRINPENSKAYWYRASMYQKSNKFSKAIIDYNSYQKLKPNDFMAYYNRGICYAQTEKYHEAMKDFSKVIDLDSTQFIAYEGRGNVKVALEDYRGACKDYKKAKKIGSGNVDEIIKLICEDDITALCEYKSEHLVSEANLDYVSVWHENQSSLNGVITDYANDYSSITLDVIRASDEFQSNIGLSIGDEMTIYIDNSQRVIDSKMNDFCETKFEDFIIKGRTIRFSILEAINGGTVNHGIWHLTSAKAI